MRWPEGLRLRPIEAWPGEMTQKRKPSPFTANLSDSVYLLSRELKHLKVKDAVIQIAVTEGQLRLDGMLRADARPDHPGVILSFTSEQGALSFPADRFTTWQDNLRAIALGLEALRKVDRYGITSNSQQYTGWLAIESGGSKTSAEEARAFLASEEISGIIGARGLTDAELVRRAKRQTHPDMPTGDREAWDKVIEAAEVLGL
jgi:hypothetical protein